MVGINGGCTVPSETACFTAARRVGVEAEARMVGEGSCDYASGWRERKARPGRGQAGAGRLATTVLAVGARVRRFVLRWADSEAAEPHGLSGPGRGMGWVVVFLYNTHCWDGIGWGGSAGA